MDGKHSFEAWVAVIRPRRPGRHFPITSEATFLYLVDEHSKLNAIFHLEEAGTFEDKKNQKVTPRCGCDKMFCTEHKAKYRMYYPSGWDGKNVLQMKSPTLSKQLFKRHGKQASRPHP